jgi:hypothetical protein
MARSQAEQEEELLRLNAQLDQQISAVEQQANSVLQQQDRLSSGGHDTLVQPNFGTGGDDDDDDGGGGDGGDDADADDGGDDNGGGGTRWRNSSTSTTSSGAAASGVGMSPRVAKAVRASAARYGGAPPTAAAAADPVGGALEKRNLSQQNQLRVQKLELAQVTQELAMAREEVGRLSRENKKLQGDSEASTKANNELKRQLAKASKELDEANALCQKLRAQNKDLDVQVRVGKRSGGREGQV